MQGSNLTGLLGVPPDLKSAAKEGVPPDLKSGVKKCPNLFRLCGFEIRSKGVCFSFCWGITNPPVLIGRTFFDGGLQIRRDAIISRKDLPQRPERAEFPSPGQHPELDNITQIYPNALKGQKLLAQGNTLG